ncbi:hypothetical protein Mal64_14300 [Pseudobythopirellula maris]|uniref:Pectate lyase n=1 Tax=Pseudobythopirellula maris TaxID=2527991 RepID=A0A5C5ZVQ5_9BACT|nr:T9SS C-terminal target domain-containing protein [Pseudobythopirellula maris]TWT91031.1 hypothetical protein Mal64_14300 [Pseudobythopirellula maris]
MKSVVPLSLSLLAVLAIASDLPAQPLRYDLSGKTGRRDAESYDWREWEIKSAETVSQQADGLSVSLRGVGAPLEGFLNKAGLVTGGTLVSDGVTCQGEAIEITLTGLAAGKHSLATFHNQPSGDSPSEFVLAAGDTKSTVKPANDAKINADAATAYVEFEATEGEPAVVRLTGEGLVLNGVEIDGSNPALRAALPTPTHGDGHADADEGTVALSWRPVAGATGYQVRHAAALDADEAEQNLATAPAVETTEPSLELSVEKNSLLSHAWRVDTVGADGAVTPGESWTFRTRSLAFPGAEGYGRFARGGRGGRVIKVTNLNDNGPGSFRAAVEAEGPRTVVFDVSGRIVLNDRLIIRNGDLTIAGQTAPGMGVCVSNFNLGAIGAEDLVVRYLRVRPGDTSGKTLDGMGLASCDHSIVDHCSISWSHDEAFSSRGALNITLQRTLISEALNIAGHKKYGEGSAHGFAASIGGDRGSFHHNLLAHCAGRNWSLAGGTDQANRHRGQLDLRNNVVYNWDYRTTDGGARLVQFVNNYYKSGPASRIKYYLKPQYENPSFGPQQYYVEGNVMEGVTGPEGPTGELVGMRVQGSQPEPVTLPEPFFEHHVTTTSAEQAYDDVLGDVGCNYPKLDEHDQRVIRETRTGTATYVGSKSGKPGLPDSQKDVGGWDDYPEVHRDADFDSDNDGMPNEWELASGLDPNDAADGPLDSNGDGYTNLEAFLNGLVD